jgi:hypothetical protein
LYRRIPTYQSTQPPVQPSQLPPRYIPPTILWLPSGVVPPPQVFFPPPPVNHLAFVPASSAARPLPIPEPVIEVLSDDDIEEEDEEWEEDEEDEKDQQGNP